MKFMKLGSKPDSFRTKGNNARVVASELAPDATVIVGDVKFYLHKFPLLSKSGLLQKLVSATNDQNINEVNISDIPGGPAAFELCAKFCYGMTVTLNAYNVVAVRCAAEYLEMHETVEKGNLVYKVEVFLSSSVFHSWKDSIIVLQTKKSTLTQLSEELKVVSRCVESISTMACVDVSRVDWSYTYNRKKISEDNENDAINRPVPRDWWVEDLCELEVAPYQRVLASIRSKSVVSNEVIGEALKAYAYRKLSGFSKGKFDFGEAVKYRSIVDAIVFLLPKEKGIVSCSFLLKLLKAAMFVDSSDDVKTELVQRIGLQLEEASAGDLTLYDVGTVQRIVEEFMMQERDSKSELSEVHESPGILSDASKLMVAKTIDSYLYEIAKDPELPLSSFVDLAETVSGIPRPCHDGIYRAIDLYLKEHPGMSKSERKRICKLMDCKKLSVEACAHAVQNERLPIRVVVQVLFFEQVRSAAASSDMGGLSSGSIGSSRTATPQGEEDWDAVAAAEEVRALKEELAALRMSKAGLEKSVVSKTKGLVVARKSFSRLFSGKGLDSPEGGGFAVNPEEGKGTPARSTRYSVS